MVSRVTKAAAIRMLPGNVLEINYFNDNYIDTPEMREIMSGVGHAARDRKIYVLHLIGEFTMISMDAKLLQINHAVKLRENIMAEAIVVSSIQTRLLEKFYCSKLSMFYSVKLFSNILSAKTWLKETAQGYTEINRNQKSHSA
jgi:hypothetical protein